MKRIVAYIRPHRIESVKSALSLLPISGMTLTDVRGTGNNPETPQTFLGTETIISLPVSSKLELIIEDHLEKEVIDTIIAESQTGSSGDGKIFVENVQQSIRIRTGDRLPKPD